MQKNILNKCLIVTANILLVALALKILLSHSKSDPLTAKTGPSIRVTEASRSLWDHGTLSAAEFYDAANLISSEAIAKKGVFWQDVFALTVTGDLYPKHSFLSAILAAPFYGLFGMNGFWIFQQIILALLIFSIARICFYIEPQLPPILLVFLIFFCTETLSAIHCYGFSYDLHSTALIICGLSLIFTSSYHLTGSALVTLSILVRPSHVLFLPILFCKKLSKDSVLGALSILLMIFFINLNLWGSPFVTSYHRLPFFDANGQMFISTHQKGFNFTELFCCWAKKLYLMPNGLIIFNSSLALLVPSIFSLLKHKNKNFFISTSLASLAYAVYIFSYESWSSSGWGNRFLLPAVFLSLPTVSTAINKLASTLKKFRRLPNYKKRQ